MLAEYVLRVARQIARRRQVSADDLAQTAYAKALPHLDRLRFEEPTWRSYVFGIVNNVAVDMYRSQEREERAREVLSSLENSWAARSTTVDTERKADLTRILREALDSLPEKERTVYCMVEIDEKEQIEVARELRLTRSTVGVRYHNAKQGLRRYLNRKDPSIGPAFALVVPEPRWAETMAVGLSSVIGFPFFKPILLTFAIVAAFGMERCAGEHAIPRAAAPILTDVPLLIAALSISPTISPEMSSNPLNEASELRLRETEVPLADDGSEETQRDERGHGPAQEPLVMSVDGSRLGFGNGKPQIGPLVFSALQTHFPQYFRPAIVGEDPMWACKGFAADPPIAHRGCAMQCGTPPDDRNAVYVECIDATSNVGVAFLGFWQRTTSTRARKWWGELQGNAWRFDERGMQPVGTWRLVEKQGGSIVPLRAWVWYRFSAPSAAEIYVMICSHVAELCFGSGLMNFPDPAQDTTSSSP